MSACLLPHACPATARAFLMVADRLLRAHAPMAGTLEVQPNTAGDHAAPHPH